MKLFLSSTRLPSDKERAQLFNKKTSVSVAIVPNARDVYPAARQQAEVERTINQFKEQGYSVSVLDLVTRSVEQVEHSLAANDLVWVDGGNTFYLNQLVQKSGFDKVLRRALEWGLVYGGASAGAVITGPTLHGVEHVDDPALAHELIWEGMGLVDFGIVPHWGTERYAEALVQMKKDMEPHVPRVITLTDEQAVIVVDGNVQII